MFTVLIQFVIMPFVRKGVSAVKVIAEEISSPFFLENKIEIRSFIAVNIIIN